MLKENQKVLFVKDGMVRKGVVWELGLLDVQIKCPDYKGIVIVSRGHIADSGITKDAVEVVKEQELVRSLETVDPVFGLIEVKEDRFIRYESTTYIDMEITEGVLSQFFPDGINKDSLQLQMHNGYFHEVFKEEGVPNKTTAYLIEDGEVIDKNTEKYVVAGNLDLEIELVITSEEGYWNNDMGWVKSKQEATVFESNDYDLPIGNNVKWENKRK